MRYVDQGQETSTIYATFIGLKELIGNLWLRCWEIFSLEQRELCARLTLLKPKFQTFNLNSVVLLMRQGQT